MGRRSWARADGVAGGGGARVYIPISNSQTLGPKPEALSTNP